MTSVIWQNTGWKEQSKIKVRKEYVLRRKTGIQMNVKDPMNEIEDPSISPLLPPNIRRRREIEAVPLEVCIYATVGYIPQKMMRKYLKKQRLWSIPVLLYEVKWGKRSFWTSFFFNVLFYFLKKVCENTKNHLTKMNVLANLRIIKYYCFEIFALDIYWWSKLSLDQVSEVKVKCLSRVQLFATPWTVAYQAPPSMGFSRQECWSGLPFPSPRSSKTPFKSHLSCVPCFPHTDHHGFEFGRILPIPRLEGDQ